MDWAGRPALVEKVGRRVIAAAVQWAEGIVQKIDNVFGASKVAP